MNDFLNALKADLLDRRLRAVLILLLAGLIGAVAYAALGSSGSSPAASAHAVSPGSGLGGSSIAPVAAGANPNQALAETPGGAAKQRDGSTRDPFNPLPGAAAAAASTGASSKGSSGSKSTSKSGGTTPTSSEPSTPPKPQTTYAVTVQMGQIPPGTPPQSASLTAYDGLKFQQKLPSPELRLLAFDGVSSDAKKAKFKLIGEVIPRGGLAVCSPSPTQCQKISLAPSQTEELEYLPPTGPALVYLLQVASITAEKH